MCKRFYFNGFDFDNETGLLKLNYQSEDFGSFCEQVLFPGAPFFLTREKKKALDRIFFYALLAGGISYFKMRPTDTIVIQDRMLNKDEANFFNTFYISGLGEFAVRNHLNLQQCIRFPIDNNITTEKVVYRFPVSDRVFIPVGGGKDSCVTTELIKKMSFNPILISVGNPKAIKSCADVADLPHHVIQRTLDPNLKVLNESGCVYNGHIPITGVLAFYLWAYAVLTDTPYVAMSCERSSNEGNMMQDELMINHQYSKSLSFERDFYLLTQSVTPDFSYFSLLRPLSEIHIARLFSKYCQSYFNVFTSCNKAFRLDEKKRLTHWCGLCDKCRFVFLILAPFMKRETLIKALGGNPLNDLSQETGYRELLGLTGHKPFECVGTPTECRWAFSFLSKNSDWQNDVLVQKLSPDLLKDQKKYSDSDLFSAMGEHQIPAVFSNVFSLFK